jgi:hypothetical protein
MTTSTGKPGTWITSSELAIGHELNDGLIVKTIKRTAKSLIVVAALPDGTEYKFSQKIHFGVLVADNA